MAEIKPYKYFDTPDGEDIFKKLLCVLKPVSISAFGIGIADVMCYSHPKGYLPTLGRFFYVGWPLIGASTAFVCATNMSANLRHKDDKINWFIGGFTAGSVFGLWRKRSIIGFNMGMLIGIFAVIRKTMHENNWVVTPPDDVPIARQGVWNYDFTLMKERPRNWTTGK